MSTSGDTGRARIAEGVVSGTVLAYARAFEEWEATGEAAVWDGVTAVGEDC
ncbi:hypothetical protein NY547_13065 [Cnuibacter physcomitrellae]|uniref:hypothetical protein n=1 Tax=Cnuibacter physcomitrellae TaxID=1619308 RepID=UPI002175CFFD|nr:hypothetical protein [Cnuibacter physcomitrellae]MCS5498175.1 hypothetical protein [Cnuibacter physcomitrellae]